MPQRASADGLGRTVRSSPDATETRSPAGTCAKRVGAVHGGSNVLVVVLFALAWWRRSSALDLTPTPGTFAIEVIALLLGTFAGWLGGEFVVRLGVGVHEGANLDASNSLPGLPAHREEPRATPARKAS